MTTTDYHLEGLAVPETLMLLHELLERVASEHPDVPAHDLMLLETAVIELAGNVVQHGVPPGRVTYTFDLRVGPDALRARLEDSGQAVPDAGTDAAMPDAWSEHGRGLPLVHAALDEVEYERVDGRNAWRLVRRRGTG